MRLEWVNHASFVLEHGDVRLMSDPWLEGRVFADGWGLLSESTFDAKRDFADISHLWFSHEHPDHFCPPNLRLIPPEVRKNLRVLFQQTADRKVVNWCREQGYQFIRELPPAGWVELASDVRVLNQPARYDDSWLAVEAGDQLLLNLNDCILDTEPLMHEVMDLMPRPVDVLLVQYSYSARVANPGDDEAFRKESERILRNITMMTRVANPRYVIPFASMVWFCHEENAYMNAGVTSPGRAFEHLRRTTDAIPILMYPGDTWTVGEGFDSEPALTRYAADLEEVQAGTRTLVHPATHDFDSLVEAGELFAKKLFHAHGAGLRAAARLNAVPATKIFITDLGQSGHYSLGDGLIRADDPAEECDVALSSDALRYMFDNLWGGETLRINGRYAEPHGGDFHRFERYITLGDFANHGHSYVGHQARRALPRAIARARRLIDNRGAAASA